MDLWVKTSLYNSVLILHVHISGDSFCHTLKVIQRPKNAPFINKWTIKIACDFGKNPPLNQEILKVGGHEVADINYFARI